jgi:hypothetical protein
MICGSAFAISAEQLAIAGVARTPMNATAIDAAINLGIATSSHGFGTVLWNHPKAIGGRREAAGKWRSVWDSLPD